MLLSSQEKQSFCLLLHSRNGSHEVWTISLSMHQLQPHPHLQPSSSPPYKLLAWTASPVLITQVSRFMGCVPSLFSSLVEPEPSVPFCFLCFLTFSCPLPSSPQPLIYCMLCLHVLISKSLIDPLLFNHSSEMILAEITEDQFLQPNPVNIFRPHLTGLLWCIYHV